MRNQRHAEVEHSMWVLERHVLGLGAVPTTAPIRGETKISAGNVLCDEETIMRAIFDDHSSGEEDI